MTTTETSEPTTEASVAGAGARSAALRRIPFDDGWAVRPKTSIFAQLGGAGEPATAVVLPHDAMVGQERAPEGLAKNAYYPRSAAFEYAKRFEVPAEWAGKRVSLQLEGAYRDAVVFVNDGWVGQRPYGYSTFTLPLDDHLLPGQENTVRVEVRGHDDARWYTGVGITRSAVLLVDEPVHTAPDGIRITTPTVESDLAAVEVRVEVVNATMAVATVSLVVDVLDDDRVVATASSPVTVLSADREVARVRAYLPEPRLWSVDTPALYTARVRLEDPTGDLLEERVERFGVRTLQLDPVHGLRINGETVKLRGACIHADNGPLGAAAFRRAEERRVELLKAAGFNAIRSAHNPISSAMLDACDRVGMLVMDETWDTWSDSKSSFDHSLRFADWWQRDVEALVAQDFNHPSVIFYSIGNEIPETGSPLGTRTGRRIAEKVRELDPTRLITNGVNGFVSTLADVMAMMRQHGADGAAGGVNDAMGSAGDMMNRVTASPLVTAKTAETFAVLDVAGLNYGDGRYEMDRDLFPNRLIVGTETFPPHIDVLWDLVVRNPHVLGDFTWTGWDYLGEVGIGRVRYTDEPPQFEAAFPWRTAWCGDIDITGVRRPISYYRETVFGLRHEPYLAVHRPETRGRTAITGGWSWTDSLSSWTWQAEPGQPLTVDVYSDAEEIELLCNGRLVDRTAVGTERAFQARFEVGWAPGELVAVAYTDGAEVARSMLRTATGSPAPFVEPDRSTIGATDGDLAYVAVELRDPDGVLVTDRDALVKVEVVGAGVLQALSSGRPDSSEAFTASSCTTFDGRALAIVRPTGSGAITVTATMDGVAATCTVEAVDR